MWGDSFIRWREFVPIFISMAVVVGALFAFVLALQAAAMEQTITAVEKRIDRIEKRNETKLLSIENKLDQLIGKSRP